MGVKLVSASAGSVEIVAPATASNFTATMPAGSGTVVISGVNSAIVSGTAVASTSGTAIDFTGFPSWVKRITVMFNGVSTNGTSGIIVQVGSGSFTTSGYTAFASRTAGTTVASTSSTAGFPMLLTVAAESILGSMVIQNITSNTWLSNHTCGYNSAGSIQGGGSVSLGGTLDQVRITTVNGTDTFDAGSINILYE